MPLKKIKIAGNAYDAWATKPDVEEAKKNIKGADSTNVFDCGQSIPACSFDSDAYWDIYLEDDKYWLVAESEIGFPQEPDAMLGAVACATEVDAEAGLLLCTSFTNPSSSLTVGNVKKLDNNYYLDTSAGATFIPVEAGKNYRCKEVIDIKYYNPRPLPGFTITGYLYLWEEYDGDSIHDAKEEILDAVNNIDIDTSTLAQQGDNPDVSLTSVSAEIGTGSDTAAESGTLFAVLKWVKDKVKSIFNLIGSPASGQPSTLFAAIAAGGGGGGDAQESTSQTILSRIGSAGSGQSATLFGAIGDVALSAATLQSLADSWAAMVTNRNSIAGVTFVEDVNGIVDALNILARLGYQYSITEINDDASTILPFKLLNGNRTLQRVTFQSVTTISGTNEAFQSTQGILYINLPSVTRIETYRNFKNATVREVHISNCSYIYTYEQFTDAVDLILLEIGGGMTGSFNIATWSPTNALSSSSSSLVEPGETFANNLEKLLYNIRTYIAAELPDRTGLSALTITFSAAIKAAIQADSATAQAFSNKNWTIA